MTTPDPGSLLPIALEAITSASDLMRTQRPASLTEKDDRDLVSDVDVTIERAVRARLQDATPGIGFLGEEEGQSGATGSGWLWTLDPIDGTSNFAHGIPLCAASLALLHDGRPVLAVIDAPFLGQRYHAVEGHGAYHGSQRLAVSTTAHLREAIVAVGDYATGHGADRKNQSHLATTYQLTPRVHRIRMLGTAALDLAWVAAGYLDASITLSNQPWDTAAGVLLAREAGASVVDANGHPHQFTSAATIAAAPALTSELIRLIRASDIASPPTGTVPDLTSYAELDAILSQAQHLIFDFDGPVCDLSAAIPPDTPDQLRAIIRAEAGELPPSLTKTGDLAELLRYAATISPGLAAHVDAKLSDIEIAAIPGAITAAYLDDALAACRDSGRSAAIISQCSAAAIRAYLTASGLAESIQHIFAPGSYPPGHLEPRHQVIANTIQALGAQPDRCALVTASADGIETARSTSTQLIGYAATPSNSDRLTAAGATCIIPSLADLTLRLRARPLPN
jgi:myo-inositol-1(or 4)-monophosphatase